MKFVPLLSVLPTLVSVLFVASAAASSAGLPLTVTLESRVDSLGETAEITLTNLTSLPMLCEQLDISLTLIRAENDLPVGTLDSRFSHIFIYPGQSLTESNLGANELKRLRASDQSVRLFKVIPTLGSCRTAEFVDYCAYAPMGADEKLTLDALNRAFGVDNCKEWRADSVTKISLAHAAIQDLTALAYFHNLKTLHLGDNPIHSIGALQSVKSLERVCLANTPVAQTQPLPPPYSNRCE